MSSTGNEQFIKYVKTYLICAGMWKRPLTNSKANLFYKGYSVYMQTTFVAFCLLCWTEFLRMTIQKYDTKLVMSTLLVVINTVKMAMKFAIYHKNKVFDLFDDVIRIEGEVWACDDAEIKMFYSKKIKICQNFILVQGIYSLFAVSALHVIGLIGNIRLMEHNKTYNDTLETHYGYQIWLPFNKLDHVYLYYGCQVVATWTGYLQNCVSHMIITLLLIFQAAHLEILQIRIRKFVPTNDLVVEHKVSELKNLILVHQYFIEFVQNLNKSIKSIIFMEFLLSSFDLASVVVTLVKMETMQEIGQQFSFILALCIQVFILAWTANEVKVQSENIADALFESNWFLLNKEGGHLIQFMIARAQKPLVINIGPFGPMTTQSAVLIIRAAYSYVSIMKQ